MPARASPAEQITIYGRLCRLTPRTVIIMGLFGRSTKCGDKEELVQPGGLVKVKCTRTEGHDGNHYDRWNNLEWGNDPLVDYKDRASHFG